MKKFKKLSINKMNCFPYIVEQEQMDLKGGGTAPGYIAYAQIYGYTLPANTGYDVQTDTCFYWSEDPNQQGTISQETYLEMWNRMNDHNGTTGGHWYGHVYQWAINNLMGGN